MKIDHARIFTADLCQVTQSTAQQRDIEGVSCGSFTYKENVINKGIVVVFFNDEVGYVPVWHLKNSLQYLSAKINIKPGISLKDSPTFLAQNGEKYIKNIKPLFKYPGKISLQQLMGIQRLQSDKDCTGGLELIN